MKPLTCCMYQLAHHEDKRLYVFAESVAANCRISQVVWQRIPHQRAGHRESPLAPSLRPQFTTGSVAQGNITRRCQFAVAK